jgi:bla regulator protein blaR1
MHGSGIASSLAAHATAWLATYALHSTLLVGLAWLASRRLGRRSVRLEEAVWRCALLGALATATLQVATRWEPLAGSLHLAAPAVAVQEIVLTAPAAENSTAPAVAGIAAAPVLPATGAFLPLAMTQVPQTHDAAGPADAAAKRTSTPASRLAWPSVVALLWAAAALAFALRLGLSHWSLHRRLRSRLPIAGGTLFELLRRLAPRAALGRPVELSCSHRVPVPVALGVARPEVCVPPRVLSHLDPEQQESLLAHELAHLVRRDPLWLALTQALASVLFFQPLNWVARRRLRDISELLCDEWAVARTGRPLSLAGCLAEVAQWSLPAGPPLPAPCLAVRRSQLGLRIRRLLDRGTAEPAAFPRWGVLLMAGALLAFAAIAPEVSARADDPTPQAAVAAPATPEPAPALETPEAMETPEAPDATEVEPLPAEPTAQPAPRAKQAPLPAAPSAHPALAPLPPLPTPHPLTPAQLAQIEAVRAQAEALDDEDFELSPETEAAIERLAENAREMAEEMGPATEKFAAAAAAYAEALAADPEIQRLEREIAAQAERLAPSAADVERLTAQAKRLAELEARSESGTPRMSREEIDKLREEARRMAESMRPSQEELQKLRALTEKHRQAMEELRKKHRAEMDELRRQMLEETRALREKMGPLNEERRRELREEHRRLRDQVRREIDAERERMRRERARPEHREKPLKAKPPKVKPHPARPAPPAPPASPAPQPTPAPPAPAPALAPQPAPAPPPAVAVRVAAPALAPMPVVALAPPSPPAAAPMTAMAPVRVPVPSAAPVAVALPALAVPAPPRSPRPAVAPRAHQPLPPCATPAHPCAAPPAPPAQPLPPARPSALQPTVPPQPAPTPAPEPDSAPEPPAA